VAKSIFGWFDGIRKSFKPVLTLDGRKPVYGFAPGKVKWPKANTQLKTSAAFLKKVYGGWWASKMVGPLPEKKKLLMRLQFSGHNLFAKKAGFAIKTSKMGTINHCGVDLLDPGGAGALAFATEFGKIVFACPAVKISKHRKPSDRIVVMTAKAVYRTDKWKVKTGRYGSLSEIVSVTVTGEADGVVVLHGQEEGSDVVLNVGTTDCNLVYAFVAHMVLNAKNGGHTLKVTVLPKGKPLMVNNSGKPGPKGEKELRFMKDPAEVRGTRWKPGSKSFEYF
jgi:hypothetical protein